MKTLTYKQIKETLKEIEEQNRGYFVHNFHDCQNKEKQDFEELDFN